ncbi:MAG: hypothetical protein EOQ36_31245 [Mesorhizobium sp.]|uniref:hypothetical protein n=1 Tax=Mesorhizobium sp. TaxID=1871066 RepID=UPI000FE62499|nr:hypothetical protein [Mesorhizobium sp.]RWF81306.1 MAG: hypothetical protein EOQ36_31245 [Mesorhizobium sp.]TJW49689.1 MAG: hypothetical protein E5X65_32155 [Mesorhizobium sp.]
MSVSSISVPRCSTSAIDVPLERRSRLGRPDGRKLPKLNTGERLEHGSAAAFIDAGLSRRAGYPDWCTLLADIAKELRVSFRERAK